MLLDDYMSTVYPEQCSFSPTAIDDDLSKALKRSQHKFYSLWIVDDSSSSSQATSTTSTASTSSASSPRNEILPLPLPPTPRAAPSSRHSTSISSAAASRSRSTKSKLTSASSWGLNSNTDVYVPGCPKARPKPKSKCKPKSRRRSPSPSNILSTKVPLRDTHATDDMFDMMGAFRLDPFANSHAREGGGYSVISADCDERTWCGEIAAPLEYPPMVVRWHVPGYGEGIEDGEDVTPGIWPFSPTPDDSDTETASTQSSTRCSSQYPKNNSEPVEARRSRRQPYPSPKKRALIKPDRGELWRSA